MFIVTTCMQAMPRRLGVYDSPWPPPLPAGATVSTAPAPARGSYGFRTPGAIVKSARKPSAAAGADSATLKTSHTSSSFWSAI